MIDVDHISHTIVIHAVNADVAHERLHWWLSEHPELKVADDRDHLEAVASFRLQSGIAVADGVRLVCSYQKVRQRKAS